MVVLIPVIDTKPDDDPVQESVFTVFLSPGVKVFTCVKNKLIFPSSETITFKQWCFTTAVSIGNRSGYGVVLTGSEEVDSNPRGWATIGSIQYMCRQASHYDTGSPRLSGGLSVILYLSVGSISVWL
jgi:hypothetical protein